MSDTREYNFNLFHEISERLSRWKEFGKLINLEEHIIEIIEVAHPTCYERAYQCMKTKNEMSKEKCLKSDWMYWKSILTQLGMEGLKTIQYIEDKYPILHKYITDIVQRKVDTPEYNFNLFHEISGRLSRWKEFGRLINLEEHIIEIIEVAHPTCYEKAYQCMKTKNEMSKEKCLKSDWIYWKSILIQLDNEGLNAIQYIEEKYPILLRYITDIEQRKVDDTKETPVKSSAIELHVNGKQMTKYELIVDNNFSNSHIGNVKVINDNSVIHNHYHSSTELRSISSVSSSLEVSSSLLDDTQETPVTSLAIEHHVVDHHCIYDGCGMFGHDATNEDNFETIPINEETRIKVNIGAGEIKIFSLRKLKDLPPLQEEYFNNYPLLKDITKYDFSKDALTRECQILSMLNTWLNGDGFVIRGYNVDKHFELFTKGFNDKLSNSDSHITMFSQKQSVIVHIEIASNDIHESFSKNLRQIKHFRSLHADSIDKGIVHIPLILYDNNINIKQVEAICNECLSLQLIAPVQIVKDINQWEQWWDNVSEHIQDIKYELKGKTSTEIVAQTLLSSVVTFMALTEFRLPSFATNPIKQTDELKKLILLTPDQLEILYSKHKRLIIKGCYGSGKSIVAQKRIKFILESIKDDEWLYYLCHDPNTCFVEEMKALAKELNRDKLEVCTSNMLIECDKKLSLILKYLSGKHGDDIVHLFVEEFNGESLDESEVKELKNIIDHSFAESHILLVAQSMESQRCIVKCYDSVEIRNKSYQYKKLVNEANFHLHHLKYAMRFSKHINNLINVARFYLEPVKVSFLFPNYGLPSYQQRKNTLIKVLNRGMSIEDKVLIGLIDDTDKSLKRYTTHTNYFTQLNNGNNFEYESKYNFIGERKAGHNIKGIVPRIYYPLLKENRKQSYRKQMFWITLLLHKIIERNEKYVIVCMNESSLTCLYIALATMGIYKYTHSVIQFSNGHYQILLTDYTSIRGCEYANIILIYPTNELHLKHHVVDCISRSYLKLRIIVLRNEFFENNSTLMQILCEWEKRKLLDSFKVVISSDQQIFLEGDLNKELIGSDTDYLKFKEVYKIKFGVEEHVFFKEICFGAEIRPLQVADKDAELVMVKRHQFYFNQVRKIERLSLHKYFFKVQYILWKLQPDMYLFYSRFASELDITIICDQCDKVFTGFIECRYRCLVCTDFDICESCYIGGNNPRNHSETHKVLCMRFKCRSCGGYIVGTRFNCTVCPDFDLCWGCFDREPFPASHDSSHKMKRSNNLSEDNIEIEQENVYEEYAIYETSDQGKVVEILKE